MNKFQNKYLLKTTRKKKQKKNQIPEIINTRIRPEIKRIIKEKDIKTTMSKPKYDSLHKHKEQISSLSDEILKNKQYEKEPARKMMVRMVHGTLPTCEKLNRLVKKEQKNTSENNKYYYTNKYGTKTNDGMCPCCGEDEETTRHLFFECENQTITELREQLGYKVNAAIALHVEKVSISTKFIGTDDKVNNWDNYLSTLGLIPNTAIKELKEQLTDEQAKYIKYIAAEISNKIMEVNIEIWKYRCKVLYSTRQEVT